MATTTEHNSSRRALLAAGLGGLAATVAQSIGQPALVRAGVDGDVILGVANSASSTTGIASSGPGAALETSTSSSTGWAIVANSTDYPAVFASSAGNAGVYGVGHGSNGAVLGQSLGTGPGVLGSAGVNHTTPPTGTGIFGYGSQGVVGQGDGLTGYVGVQGFVGAPDPPPPAPLTGNHPTGTYGEANGADPTGVWGQGGTVDSGFSTGVYGEGDTGVWGYGGWAYSEPATRPVRASTGSPERLSLVHQPTPVSSATATQGPASMRHPERGRPCTSTANCGSVGAGRYRCRRARRMW